MAVDTAAIQSQSLSALLGTAGSASVGPAALINALVTPTNNVTASAGLFGPSAILSLGNSLTADPTFGPARALVARLKGEP